MAAGADLYDNSLMHHLRHDRPSISPTYAHKCTHGHMYLVLETFIRAKSPTRLSCRWSRIVRQLSDAPPQARTTVNLHSIRTKMYPRTHVPRARCWFSANAATMGQDLALKNRPKSSAQQRGYACSRQQRQATRSTQFARNTGNS